MKKSKSLSSQIEELEMLFDDSYFKALSKALSNYHSMVEAGVLIPRGNRLADNPTNYVSNCVKRV